MKKKTFFLACIILSIIVVISLSFNVIIKSILTMTIEKMTGAYVTIRSFDIDILKQEASIKNFVLYNPPGFPNTPFIDIPEVTVAIKSDALFKGSVDLPLVILNLREVNLIRNAEGKLNVDSLKFVQKPEDQKPKAPKEPGKTIPFKIDVLKLTIGKVVSKELRANGKEVNIKTYNLGISDREFKNITSPQQLASLLLMQAMNPTAITSAALNAAASVFKLDIRPIDTAVDAATGILNRVKERLNNF